MSSEDIKILQFNQYQRLDKRPVITYADQNYDRKIDLCKSKPDKLSTKKAVEHIPLASIIWSFRDKESKYNVYIKIAKIVKL